MKIHLSPDDTSFHVTGRGLLVTHTAPHTTTRFLIPRATTSKITELGVNTQCQLGKACHLTMPNTMWASHGDGILAACHGPDYEEKR